MKYEKPVIQSQVDLEGELRHRRPRGGGGGGRGSGR